MGAVEWIAEKVRHNPLMSRSDYNKLLEQAKAMEEEQRRKDINFGHGIPSWVDINFEAYFKLSSKREKLPTFELTEEGEIDGVTLCTASSEDRKVVLLVEDIEGNFFKLGKDAKFHPLPKTDEKSKEESPAEKAHEIFEKMFNAEDPMGNYPMCFDTAKQCALIAVDEVLKLHKRVALNTLHFYVEVRREILNYKKPE